jgi:hypothetical protein
VSAATVKVTGLNRLVRELKGPAFRDVNKELRQHARTIARDLIPAAAEATTRSGAPQAAALSRTWRVHSDRVPVLAMGKVNPRFGTGFTHRGETAAQRKRRRGSLAHGVVYGPKGGKRSTAVGENYYRIGRDSTGGALGAALDGGPMFRQACGLYLRVYVATLKAHGFDAVSRRVI